MRNAKWPDISISPQVIISCAIEAGDGCHGGDAGKAYAWMSQNDVTDETCSIYQARGHDNGLPCGGLSLCETCEPGTMTRKIYSLYAYRRIACGISLILKFILMWL